ncbi:MAG: hypothetical protein ACPIOQ_11230, partial [Promethearchaeia archaeon]
LSVLHDHSAPRSHRTSFLDPDFLSDAELDDYFNTYDDDANPDAIGCVVDDRYTVTWSAAFPHPHLSRPAILTFMLHRSLYPSTTTASDFVSMGLVLRGGNVQE